MEMKKKKSILIKLQNGSLRFAVNAGSYETFFQYNKAISYSKDATIRIPISYLFGAHSFFGFVRMSSQFDTQSPIQYHFFYPVSLFVLLFDFYFAFLDVSLCISSPFNTIIFSMLKY
jgi:hypothetical protein